MKKDKLEIKKCFKDMIWPNRRSSLANIGRREIKDKPCMSMVQSTLVDSKRRLTLIIVEEFHVEADVIRQWAEILHQHVKFTHQQHTGFLGVVTGHFSQALPAFAENTDIYFHKRKH